MIFRLFLVIKSLWNRRFSTLLTISSLSISVALLIGVERVRQGARESFSGTISKTDLIVGGRGGSMQLLLYTVFRIGNATNNISFDTYKTIKNNSQVEWTIPYSLGDSHRSFRVVGTDENFYEHYRFRGDQILELHEGKAAQELFDVTLGSDVAVKLEYKLGQKITLTHGAVESPSAFAHKDKPFTIVGILKKTNTPIDKSVYITLQGMEAIHIGWQNGAPPQEDTGTTTQNLRKEDVKVDQITSFLVRAKSRIQVLNLQRSISNYEQEPLTAIIPGVAMSELWSTVEYAEIGLKVVSFFVIVVGLIGMLISLYTALEARRREMAILRSVGAGVPTIAMLLVAEAFVLSVTGCIFGVGIAYAALLLARPLVEAQIGVLLPLAALSSLEWIYLAGLIASALLLGLLPSWRAVKNSLADGLTLRM